MVPILASPNSGFQIHTGHSVCVFIIKMSEFHSTTTTTTNNENKAKQKKFCLLFLFVFVYVPCLPLAFSICVCLFFLFCFSVPSTELFLMIYHSFNFLYWRLFSTFSMLLLLMYGLNNIFDRIILNLPFLNYNLEIMFFFLSCQ